MNSRKITLITVLMVSTLISYSQIAYTDISPDVTTTLNPTDIQMFEVTPIDFDGDGTEEYNFRWDYFNANDWFVHMTKDFNKANDAFVYLPPNGDGLLDPLTLNTTIGATSNWGVTGDPFVSLAPSTNFQDLGDRYIGVRFELNDNTHYGWVLVSYASLTLTVKGYAYNETPDTPIDAGDTGALGVTGLNFQNNFSAFPLPTTRFLSIKSKQNNQIQNIEIYDLTGRLVTSTKIKVINEELISIDVSSLNKGVYVIKLIDNHNKNYIKKILKS